MCWFAETCRAKEDETRYQEEKKKRPWFFRDPWEAQPGVASGI